MMNINRAREILSKSADKHVQVSCPCSFYKEYDDFSELESDGWIIVMDNPPIMSCPQCSNKYTADIITVGENQKTEYLQISLQKGEENRQITSPIGECPDCGNDITPKNRRANSQFPETGWEYYLCSNCENAINTSLIEN